MDTVAGAFVHLGVPVERGATWTTDAPFRETQETIDAMTARGLLAVEMEAATLYAFAEARRRRCFAHVTDHMAMIEGDRYNIKLTTPADVLVATAILRAKKAEERPPR